MANRAKNRGLVYLRRSSDRQETSLRAQVDWATTEAGKLDLHLVASPADVAYAQAHRLHAYKDIRLDDSITGADLNRPGFRALINDALTNRDISHLFIFKRDRFARPEDAIEMVALEKKLLLAGITIVFSEGIAEPMQRGQDYRAREFTMLFGYYESGEFLNKLAERVLLAQKQLALQGFRTGGNAPYGFVRVLVDGSGRVLEELLPGRHVRQEGCHVRIVPKDEQKIAIWLHILDLKHRGWGLKRIAQHLNDLGVPSPGAGSMRTDQGVKHRVSGKWNANTIRDLCDNRAILGLQDFGRRSEGAHRRLSKEGPRLLTDADRNAADQPKLVMNDASVIVTASIGTPAQFDMERWQDIQRQKETRGHNQRGIPRTKDPARYPLSCRVVDLTDGCGSVMYGRTHGNRAIYSCGRYMRTEGAECSNNIVDGEALLRFTLTTIHQLASRHGNPERLRQLLLERAQREKPAATSSIEMKFRLLTARCCELQNDLGTVRHRMAREKEDSRYQALAEEFDRIVCDLAAAEKELRTLQALQLDASPITPDQEVEAAMRLLHDINRIATDAKARSEVNPLLSKLGVWIGLTFTEAIKGKKRKVRRLLSGRFTFGDGRLPVPLFGADNRQPPRGSGPGSGHDETGEHRAKTDADREEPNPAKGRQTIDRVVGRVKTEKAETAAFAAIPADSASERATQSGFQSQPEGISFTKGSRGERI